MEYKTLIVSQFIRSLHQSTTNFSSVLSPDTSYVDILDKNKNSTYNEPESFVEIYADGKIIDESMEEEELIEIEREWLKLQDNVDDLTSETDEESETESDEFEESASNNSYPIQNVLHPTLLRSIFVKAAAEAKKLTHISANSSAYNTTQNQNIQPSLISSNRKIITNSKDPSINKRDNTPNIKEKKCKKKIKEMVLPNVNHIEEYALRKEKSRIQSIIKSIENELEGDVGNGYGDSEWCRAFTQSRKNKNTAIGNSGDRQIRTVSISEERSSIPVVIPTPSWRIIDEYDYHETSDDSSDSDNEIHKSESDDSDYSDETGSSMISNSTWVSPDTIREYVMPERSTCDMKIEIRLVNLSRLQIQAVRKRLKLGLSQPNNVRRSVHLERNRDMGLGGYEDSCEFQSKYTERRRSFRNTNKGVLSSITSRDKEKIDVSNRTEMSKSSLKELARLQFSSAGPKIEIHADRKAS